MATVQETARKMIDAGASGSFSCSYCAKEDYVDPNPGTDAVEIADQVRILADLLSHTLFDHATRADLLKVEYTVVFAGKDF